MIYVNTHEAKTRLSELLAKLQDKNECVVICRHGTPVASLNPWVKSSNPLRQSKRLRRVVFHENPALPATNDEWPEKAR